MTPPRRPDPPLAEDGRIPVQFPHCTGWHTDQSFRRPPPDISLFYAHTPAPKGQGQTLFANGVAALEALPTSLRQRVEGLHGLHAVRGVGRTEEAARAGQTPEPLLSHQRSQAQPVIRVHPVTGKRAMYLCGSSQMDWVDGPFVGMETGPDSAGGRLLYELMAHFTQREFTYAHDWDPGDLVITTIVAWCTPAAGTTESIRGSCGAPPSWGILVTNMPAKDQAGSPQAAAIPWMA